MLRPPKGVDAKSVPLAITSDEAHELLNQGWLHSQEPVTKGLGSTNRRAETQLRDGGKWETLRHSRINLRAEDISLPRLEVSYIARRAGTLEDGPSTIPFAILVTVSDRSNNGNLYDLTAKQFVTLRPVQRVVSRLRIRGDDRGDV
jgi:hypothetical protein